MVLPLRSIINQALTGGWTMPEGFSDLVYRGGMEPLAAPAAFGAWSGASNIPALRQGRSLSEALFGLTQQAPGGAQPAGSGRRLSDTLFGVTRGATGGASGVAAVGSSPGATDLWSAIDQAAGGDQRVALAMKVAAQMESGGRLDAVGDGGQSHGPFQIYQKAHGRNITPDQSRDPVAASAYMLPEFKSAVQRVSDALWQSDPARAAAQAAFFAERPAVMYPDARVRQAYATVTARAQPGAAAPPVAGTVAGSVAPAAATPVAQQGLQAAAIAEARKYIGMPYLLAGQANNPKAGAFDCSGLVQWSFGQAGKALPRVAQGQYDASARISAEQARPGDLVFFTGTYNAGTPVTHVGIYLGGDKMLQAGSSGVGYADLTTPYWRSKLYGWGRVG